MIDANALPVGDPVRVRARRALGATVVTGLSFFAFAVISTQDKTVRAHSPWQDDPFDVVVSFTLFLVPMLLAALIVRVQLCRANRPLPSRRISDLLRCARLALAAVALTVLTDWCAVALQEHASVWSQPGEALIAALGLLTILVVVAAAALVAAGSASISGDAANAGPDWIEDMVTLASQHAGHLGKVSGAAHWAVDLADQHLVCGRFGLRRHPVMAAFFAALAFGLSLAVAQGVGEHEFTGPRSTAGVIAFLTFVGGGGMFGLLVTAGAYLRVVKPDGRHPPEDRRQLVAAVTSALSIPVTVAFRDNLGWATPRVFSNTPAAHLSVLIITIAMITGLASLIVQAAWRRRTR